MVEKQQLILITGCLAAGKTTLARHIHKQFPQLVLAQEEIWQHEVFRSWIRHEHSEGMLTQLEFYIRSLDVIMSSAQSRPAATILADFAIETHHWVYSKTLHASKVISDKEWQICCEVYSHIEALLNSKFSICYVGLYVDEAVLFERLQMRMRDSGDTIGKDTIAAYVMAFDSWSSRQVNVTTLSTVDVSSFIHGNRDMLKRITAILKLEGREEDTL